MSDPFADLRREFDSMLERSVRRWPGVETGFSAPVDVCETPDAIEVSAELPGVDEKDISIDLDGDRLVISGEKKAEEKREDKNWRVMETSYGAFQRVIALPFAPEADSCDAQFDKGVLRLKIAKPKGAKAQGRRIAIRGAGQETGQEAGQETGQETGQEARKDEQDNARQNAKKDDAAKGGEKAA